MQQTAVYNNQCKIYYNNLLTSNIFKVGFIATCAEHDLFFEILPIKKVSLGMQRIGRLRLPKEYFFDRSTNFGFSCTINPSGHFQT